MARIIRGKKRPGSDARAIAEGFGTAPAQDPRKSGPGPRNRLQAIALGAFSLRSLAAPLIDPAALSAVQKVWAAGAA
jgi:hypothetical protein